MAFIVIEVSEADTDPFWTLLDATGGVDLREGHRYATKHDAEEVADRLNGVPIEEDLG